jgi:hypothetical protein
MKITGPGVFGKFKNMNSNTSKKVYLCNLYLLKRVLVLWVSKNLSYKYIYLKNAIQSIILFSS